MLIYMPENPAERIPMLASNPMTASFEFGGVSSGIG